MRLLTAIFSRFKPIWEHYSHANVFLHMFPILQRRYLHVQKNSCYWHFGIKLRGINWPHGVKLSYVYDTAHTRTLGVPTLELKISSFWKSWLPTVRFHFLLLGLKYSNFRFRYISKIKDIFKNTHINPSVSLEKKSRDTVPLAIKKNTTQNQIWIFQNKVFSDGHMKNKTIKNVMSWHLFRKNQQ